MTGRMVLLCGRSFSGKSTVATHLAAALGGRIVSFDGINAERGLWGGDGVPVSEWARTVEIAHDRVAAAVREGTTIVIDDTSSPRFLRDDWRRLATSLGASFVLIYVQADRQTVLDRQARNRESGGRRDVSDAVMAEHLASFEPPEADEKALIFDAVGGSLDALVATIQAEIRAR